MNKLLFYGTAAAMLALAHDTLRKAFGDAADIAGSTRYMASEINGRRVFIGRGKHTVAQDRRRALKARNRKRAKR